MPWITDEQLAEARKIDLLTYLQEREPHELVRSAPGEYRTASHGSLVISNGAWFWNRGGFGSVSALDYLIKVRGMGLAEAVQDIEGVSGARASPAVSYPSVKSTAAESKTLSLPPQEKYPTRLLSYLQGRGISANVIKRCIDDGFLYESRYNGEAVCVFVGKDEHGKLRFGCMRGINSDLKRDCAGSDKRYSFTLLPLDLKCDTLTVFESPIDSLSHLYLYPNADAYRLSLGGTSDVALVSFLERNPQINRISLCLDTDDAGQTAARQITKSLGGDERFSRISVTTDPPQNGKDFNEALLHAVRLERAQKQAGHRKEAGFSID